MSSPFGVRASAYAEFMERLQNGILYGTQFGLMHEAQDLFLDARWLANLV